MREDAPRVVGWPSRTNIPLLESPLHQHRDLPIVLSAFVKLWSFCRSFPSNALRISTSVSRSFDSHKHEAYPRRSRNGHYFKARHRQAFGSSRPPPTYVGAPFPAVESAYARGHVRKSLLNPPDYPSAPRISGVGVERRAPTLFRHKRTQNRASNGEFPIPNIHHKRKRHRRQQPAS